MLSEVESQARALRAYLEGQGWRERGELPITSTDQAKHLAARLLVDPTPEELGQAACALTLITAERDALRNGVRNLGIDWPTSA